MKLDLDRLIVKSLGEFLSHVRITNWIGRENEAISLFAFGFLQKHIKPTQIGIEVAVAPSPNKGINSHVRKDLAIWPASDMNRFFPRPGPNEPLAVLEWKVHRKGFRSGESNQSDIKKLTEYCTDHPSSVGYAVWLNLSSVPVEIVVDRIDSSGTRRLSC